MRTGNRVGDIASLDFNSCAIFKDKFTKVRGEILEQSMAIIAELDHFFNALNIQLPTSKFSEDFMPYKRQIIFWNNKFGRRYIIIKWN